MFSRRQPSSSYVRLIEQYRQLHRDGSKDLNWAPEKIFAGFGLLPQVEPIKRLIDLTDAETLLDYGSGKGMQYQIPLVDIGGVEKEMIIEYWDVLAVDCYDPGYDKFLSFPTERYDGVIATDVLQHCSEQDIQWIVEELFSLARRFVFVSIACYPAQKKLPNGENSHSIIQPTNWWLSLFNCVADKKPGIKCQLNIKDLNSSGVIKEATYTI